jgi:hypothetical protein
VTVCNNVGVCPRLLVSPWAAGVVASMSWWEQGALGVTYLTAPAWLHHAYGLISRERVAASRYHLELTKAK